MLFVSLLSFTILYDRIQLKVFEKTKNKMRMTFHMGQKGIGKLVFDLLGKKVMFFKMHRGQIWLAVKFLSQTEQFVIMWID
jgi:hypothetical protein